MEYNEKKILDAFTLYARLASRGELLKLDAAAYFDDEDVRALLENYVKAVQCTLVSDSEYLYLLPVSLESPFHISNDTFKKKYLTAKSVNMDIYLMYMAVIVLFGCFYDSYQTMDPLEFVSMERWLTSMDARIEALAQHSEEELQARELEMNFNWLAILRKWSDMDSLKETVKKQDARTNSRLSFLNMTREFLLQQKLIRELGNNELALTEKARTVVSAYYMETDYNRGIMDFMYACDHQPKQEKEEQDHAIHQ